MAGEAGSRRLASRCGRGGPDSRLNGGHIAGHETFGAVVALPILPNAGDGQLSFTQDASDGPGIWERSDKKRARRRRLRRAAAHPLTSSRLSLNTSGLSAPFHTERPGNWGDSDLVSGRPGYADGELVGGV